MWTLGNIPIVGTGPTVRSRASAMSVGAGTVIGMARKRTDPDRVPPGPWTWQLVRPADQHGRGPHHMLPLSNHEEGTALVAADGTWLLWSEGGYGRPGLLNRAVEDLLREAWRVPRLVRELDETADELDEARRIARHLYGADGRLPAEYGVGREPAPDWLTSAQAGGER